MLKILTAIASILVSTSVVAAPSTTQIGTYKTSNPYPVSILFNNTWYPMGAINTSTGVFVGGVANGGTGLTAGTSGGIPYFSSSSAMASSAALTQYGVVYGGGAGNSPNSTAAGTNGNILTATTGSPPAFASASSVFDTNFSSSRGSILYRGASGWAALAPGTSGQVLTTNGAAADPSWAAGGGSASAVRPGGRLTVVAGVPVIQNNGSTSYVGQSTLYYSPYNGAYVPIYDGTTMQSVQFTSSPSDTIGLALTINSNWYPRSAYDVYVTMNSGSPVLCTVPWSTVNPTPLAGTGYFTNTSGATITTVTNSPSDVGTRIQGILVNSSSDTCRISGGSTITMGAYRGTYLGSFYTDYSTSTISWKWGGSASGGSAAVLNVWNYYNRVLVGAYLFDTGGPYTVTAVPGCLATGCKGVAAQFARNSSSNLVQLMYGRAEDSITVLYQQNVSTVYATGTSAGVGPYITSGYCINTWDYYAANTMFGVALNGSSITATNWAPIINGLSESTFTSVEAPGSIGPKYIYACESGDGVNANQAGVYYGSQLAVSVPM